jgi:hypothetical protein
MEWERCIIFARPALHRISSAFLKVEAAIYLQHRPAAAGNVVIPMLAYHLVESSSAIPRSGVIMFTSTTGRIGGTCVVLFLSASLHKTVQARAWTH